MMALWWMTEALPIAATALVPLVLFPVLQIADIGATAAPYANPLIFLFMGGFMLETYGFEIAFANWLLLGLLFVVVALPIVFFVLTRFVFPIRVREIPGGKAFIRGELKALGRMHPSGEDGGACLRTNGRAMDHEAASRRCRTWPVGSRHRHVPIVASVAIGIGQNPLLLAVPATVAASCAFMLPVATPPNAIIYGSSFVTVPQMARAGVVLNMIFVLFVTLLTYLLLPFVFDLTLGVVPEWATVP